MVWWRFFVMCTFLFVCVCAVVRVDVEICVVRGLEEC